MHASVESRPSDLKKSSNSDANKASKQCWSQEAEVLAPLGSPEGVTSEGTNNSPCQNQSLKHDFPCVYPI